MLPTFLIAGLLGAAACAAVASALVSSPGPGGSRDGDTVVLAYAPRWRRAVSAALALPLAGAALVVLRRPPTTDPEAFWPLATILAAAFLVLWLVRIEVNGVRHRVSPEGIERRSPWVRPVLVPWPEVVALRWSPLAGVLVVTGAGGRTVRISRLLSGQRELVGALRTRLPLDRVAGPGVDARLATLAGTPRAV